jgi:virulence-associated protein VapD
MAFAKTEREWAERVHRHLKAELKRADVTYQELAERMKKHGFKETQASIASKLSRNTAPAAFFIAALAAIGCEIVKIEDI